MPGLFAHGQRTNSGGACTTSSHQSLRAVAPNLGPADKVPLPNRAINGILAMRQFKEQFSTGHVDRNGNPDLTNKEASIVIAILSVGTFVGSLFSAPMADSFLGRRFSMIVSCVVFCLGGVLQTVAQALPMLLAGRCVSSLFFFRAAVRSVLGTSAAKVEMAKY